MILTEQHIIKSNNSSFKELDTLMFNAKNLYNSALYEIRQHFLLSQTDDTIKYKYLNYYSVNNLMKDNMWYKSLQSQCSQQILMQLDQNFKSFFALLKKKKTKDYTERVNIPKYLPKDGRYLLKFPSNSLSKKYLEDGIIKIPKTSLKFYTKQKRIKEVRFIPRNNYILMEVVYEVDELKLKEDNGRYLAIDLGINNLATCTSNAVKPFIINGKPLKSCNHFYNKKLAKLKSELEIKHKKHSSNRTKKLTQKRNNKIKDYLHKSAKLIINQAVTSSINTLIIGKNLDWKQEINLGSRNNQSFTQIPHTTFINLIAYKAKLKGIKVVLVEESYSSKASFLDNDTLPIYKSGQKNEIIFSGKRLKRGLYKTSKGKLLNADVNGSLNIMRKYLKASSDDLISPTCTGLVFNPVKLHVS